MTEETSVLSARVEILHATQMNAPVTESDVVVTEDGKTVFVVTPAATGGLDGKVGVIASGETRLLDGKLELTGTEVEALDGLGVVKDSFQEVLDGAVAVSSKAASLLDGRTFVGTESSSLLDGQIVVGSKLAVWLDGKGTVKDRATSLLDGSVDLALFDQSLLDGKSTVIYPVEEAGLDGQVRLRYPEVSNWELWVPEYIQDTETITSVDFDPELIFRTSNLCNLSDTTALLAVTRTTASGLGCIVYLVSVAGGTITIADSLVVETGVEITACSICRLTDTTGLVVYAPAGDDVYAAIITNSAGTLSAGAAAMVRNSYGVTVEAIDTKPISSTRVALAFASSKVYPNDYTYQVTSCIDIVGTTPTGGLGGTSGIYAISRVIGVCVAGHYSDGTLVLFRFHEQPTSIPPGLYVGAIEIAPGSTTSKAFKYISGTFTQAPDAVATMLPDDSWEALVHNLKFWSLKGTASSSLLTLSASSYGESYYHTALQRLTDSLSLGLLGDNSGGAPHLTLLRYKDDDTIEHVWLECLDDGVANYGTALANLNNTRALAAVRYQDPADSLYYVKLYLIEPPQRFLAGKVFVVQEQLNNLDGKLLLSHNLDISLLDGGVKIKDSDTQLLDGKGSIKHYLSNLLDGTVKLIAYETGLLDGLAVVKSSTAELLDAVTRIKVSTTGLLDGTVQVYETAQNLLDGATRIKDSVAALLDAAAEVFDDRVSKFDGLFVLYDSGEPGAREELLALVALNEELHSFVALANSLLSSVCSEVELMTDVVKTISLYAPCLEGSVELETPVTREVYLTSDCSGKSVELITNIDME